MEDPSPGTKQAGFLDFVLRAGPGGHREAQKLREIAGPERAGWNAAARL